MTYWKSKTTIILLSILGVTACSGSSGNPVEGLGAAFTQQPGNNENPASFTDVTYKQGAVEDGNISLEMDIYLPDSTCNQNKPTILFVHGGGFLGIGRPWKWDPVPEMATAANDRGMNFISMEYRTVLLKPVLTPEYQAIVDEFDGIDTFLTDVESGVFAASEDMVSALEWLQSNNATYCLDMNRLAFWGDEAGAITALQTAYGLNQYGITVPEPDVIVSYSGALLRPSDLEFREAPMLIFSGKESTTVPYQNVQDLADAAESANVPYSFYTLDSYETFLPRGPYEIEINGRNLLTITLDFVEAHLFGGMALYETETDPN